MNEERRAIRRLLWKWGQVMEYCAARQREIDGFQEIANAARDLPPVRLTGLPGSKTPSDMTGMLAIRAEELAKQYDGIIKQLMADCDKALKFKSAMDDIISQLSMEQQKILELRYKQGCKWTFIAFKICSSERRIRRLEEQAVDQLGPYIKVDRF